MVRLIQLTQQSSLIAYAKRLYTPELLQTAERLQSDRAEIFVIRLIERYQTIGALTPHMSKYMSLEKNHERLECIMNAMDKSGLIPGLKIEEAGKIGAKTADRNYSVMNQTALDAGLNMIEWMFALLIWRDLYDEMHARRNKIESSVLQDKRITREITTLESQKEKHIAKIANIDKYIEEQQRFKQKYVDQLEEVEARLNELVNSLPSSEE